MCGIVGMISAKKNGFVTADLNTFKDLLHADIVRGRDSTGMMSMKIKGQTTWVKSAGVPSDLFALKDAGSFMSASLWDTWAVFGHNRSATRGAVNSDNAHPFEEGKITLIHNGTLTNMHEFDEWKDPDIEVDSHLIARLLDTHSVEEVISRIKGAFTLVWFDSAERKVKIIRNDERPLYMAYSLKEEKFFFASEGLMLQWCLARNGQIMNKVWSIVSGDLYEFSPESFDYTQTTLELAKPYIYVPPAAPYIPPYNPIVTRTPITNKAPIAEGIRVRVSIDDFGYATRGDTILRGHVYTNPDIRVAAIGSEDLIDFLDYTEDFIGTMTKPRKGRHKGNKVWQYTLTDIKPMYFGIHTRDGRPELCQVCALPIMLGEKISTIANGKEVIMCKTCYHDDIIDFGKAAYKESAQH